MKNKIIVSYIKPKQGGEIFSLERKDGLESVPKRELVYAQIMWTNEEAPFWSIPIWSKLLPCVWIIFIRKMKGKEKEGKGGKEYLISCPCLDD